jgi:hypothetical protein
MLSVRRRSPQVRVQRLPPHFERLSSHHHVRQLPWPAQAGLSGSAREWMLTPRAALLLLLSPGRNALPLLWPVLSPSLQVVLLLYHLVQQWSLHSAWPTSAHAHM